MVSLESSTAALWDTWRRLYPVYCSLAREIAIEAPACVDLETGIVPGVEAVADAECWFASMDSRIHIHHLRNFAQTSPLMTEEAISDLLFYALHKKQKADEDRDKIDFLVVQLIAMRLPPSVAQRDLTLECAMKLLEPAVGTGSGEPPKFTKALDDMLVDADRAGNLNALFTSRTIERSREIKQSSGNEFFEPLVLAAFARFGYLIRRRFFQLMQDDLNAILDGLRELEAQDVTTIDCRKAQFSAEEPIGRIRMICQSWRVMFQAEYSSGQPLCLLVDLKTAVESAAQNKKAQPADSIKAAAGAAGSARQSHR